MYPENYKTELLAFLRAYINNPTNIRDAAISDPVLKPVEVMGNGGLDAPVPGSNRGGAGGGAGRGSSGAGINPFEEGVSRERYLACVRYNAKDLDGRYSGPRQGMAIYANGRFDSFRERAGAACDQMEFKPFPELESLRR